MLTRHNKSESPREALRRLRGDESGQALTEFVVVAPLMVMVLLFSMWLWEIVQIKLKVQESARYAAWEATTYPLHDYATGSGGSLLTLGIDRKFLSMQTKVAAEAMIRYRNLDAARLGTGKRILMASWKQPKIVIPADCNLMIEAVTSSLDIPLCGNLEEPIVYGGPWASLLFKLAAVVFTVGSAMRFTSMNPIAEALIATGGGNALFGGSSVFSSLMGAGKGGGALVTPFGSSDWKFNNKGYVRAISTFKIENNWFNVRIMGKPLFRRSSFTVMSHHAVLADSWRLNSGTSLYDDPERKSKPNEADQRRNWIETQWHKLKDKKKSLEKSWGDFKAKHYYESGRGAYWDQLNRMYMGRPKARKVAKTFVTLFREITEIAASIAGLSKARDITDDDWMYPALSARNYTMSENGKLRGQVVRREDVATRKYHTAPFIGDYALTFQARGENFMGCPDAQAIGCTSTLSQDDPFGSYVNRSDDE